MTSILHHSQQTCGRSLALLLLGTVWVVLMTALVATTTTKYLLSIASRHALPAS